MTNSKTDAIDPIAHNTKEYLNENITLDGIKDYLCEARLEFYDKVINYCLNNGVTFNDKSILDAGCSSSYILKKIGDMFKTNDLTGYDFSTKSIEVAKIHSPEVNFQLFDLVSSKPERKFDVVFCTQVLEHILNPNIALQNLCRLVAPNGFLIVTVPNGRTDNYLGHINFWSPESFKPFIEDNLNIEYQSINFNSEEFGNSCLLRAK